ncbi:DNA polymerase III subunit beta [Spirillospora sp. NPDC049652]
MRLTVDTKAFADTVNWIARSLPSNPPVPVLAGIKLTATGDTVEAVGFDYELVSHAVLDADVAGDGTVLLPGRLLADITRRLPNGPLQLVLEDATCVLTSSRSTFTLQTLPLDDYPDLPDPPDEVGSMTAEAFATAVTQTAVAAGHDSTVPMLTGLRMELTPSQIAFAATDRFRLAAAAREWQPTSEDTKADLVVPAAALTALVKSIGRDVEHITLGLNRSGTDEDSVATNLSITAGSRTLRIRLFDDCFIKWRAVLPAEFAASVLADAGELAAAVRRVATVAERLTPVRLTCTPGSEPDGGEIELQAWDGDTATGRETLPAELVTGTEPFTIALSPGYLLDALATLSTDRACLRTTGPHKPVVILAASPEAHAEDLPGGGEPAPGDHRYLLMPIRTSS